MLVMELSLSDLGKIIVHLDARTLGEDAADELPELTAEDEAVLERAWRVLAAERRKPTVCTTMSPAETLRFFGLAEAKNI